MSLNEIITERSPHILPALPDAVERIRVSRQDLADAIASRDVFDKLYIDLTTRAGAAYQASRRSRCALKLDASLAALEECVHYLGGCWALNAYDLLLLYQISRAVSLCPKDICSAALAICRAALGSHRITPSRPVKGAAGSAQSVQRVTAEHSGACPGGYRVWQQILEFRLAARRQGEQSEYTRRE